MNPADAARTDGTTDTGNVKPVETTGGAPATFRAELKAEPSEIKAGEVGALIITIKDASGAATRDLSIVHEKPMHLLVISKDLNEFYHLHPEPQADGSYRVAHTFPNGGDYKLYVDYTPKDGAQIVDQIPLTVRGNPRAVVALKEDRSNTKTVDGLRVTMKPDKALRAGQELTLDFAVADERTNKPLTDLQPYLGALAHFVIISEDGADFLHAHPMEKTVTTAQHGDGHDAMPHAHGDEARPGGANATKPSASEVSAHTTFPRAGLYKVWAQFQRGGRVSTVPFVVRVGAGESADAGGGSADANQEPPADAIRVTVSGAGFEPSRLDVERGRPVKLAFIRHDANNCGDEVVFSKLNVRAKLPVGKFAVVEVTPQESGELAFTCGMGMMRGALVVQ